MVMSNDKIPAGALRRALATVQKNEIARHLGEMRRELEVSAREEQRIIRCACAVTGKKFAVVYKRCSPAELKLNRRPSARPCRSSTTGDNVMTRFESAKADWPRTRPLGGGGIRISGTYVHPRLTGAIPASYDLIVLAFCALVLAGTAPARRCNSLRR